MLREFNIYNNTFMLLTFQHTSLLLIVIFMQPLTFYYINTQTPEPETIVLTERGRDGHINGL